MLVVYPLTVQKEYTELMYSLRSIEKHLSQPYEIVIIGEKIPDWIKNITWINLPDIPGKKQLSIRRKILAALEYGEEILCMGDDIYLLQGKTFQYYYKPTLKGYAESGAKQVMEQLLTMGKTIKNFDIHHPIIYDQRFKEVSLSFAGECIIKSMYANYLNIEGIESTDCKILKDIKSELIRSFIKDRPCFSTGPTSLRSALVVLNELFPYKSKFEL